MKHKNIVVGIFLSLAFVFSATSFYQVVSLLQGGTLLSSQQSASVIEGLTPSMKFSLASAVQTSGIYSVPTVVKNVATTLSLTYDFNAVKTAPVSSWTISVTCPQGVSATINNGVSSNPSAGRWTSTTHPTNQCNNTSITLSTSKGTNNLLNIPVVFQNTGTASGTVTIRAVAYGPVVFGRSQQTAQQIGSTTDTEIVLGKAPAAISAPVGPTYGIIPLFTTNLVAGDNVLFRYQATAPKGSSATVATDSVSLTESNLTENTVSLKVYSDAAFTQLVAQVTAPGLDYSSAQNQLVNFMFVPDIVIPAGQTYYFAIVENVKAININSTLAPSSISTNNAGWGTYTLTAAAPVSTVGPTISVSVGNVSRSVATANSFNVNVPFNWNANYTFVSASTVSVYDLSGALLSTEGLQPNSSTGSSSIVFNSISSSVGTGGYYRVSVCSGSVCGYSPYFTVPTVTQPSQSAPTISTISPSTGQIGAATPITITGTGFTSNNDILFNGRVAATQISSSDGKTLSFFVATSTSPACNLFTSTTPVPCPANILILVAGTASLSVINANGTSNAISFGVMSPAGTTATNASVTISTDSNTPLSSEIIADNGPAYNSFSGATLLDFDLSAKGDNVILKTLNVNITKVGGSGSAVVQNVYLYNPDGLLVGSSALINGVASFNNINYWTANNATSVYSIRADIQNANGLPVSFSASVSGTTVTAQNNLGTPLAASVITGSAIGNIVTFRNVGPEFTLVSQPTVTKSTSNSQTGSSTSVLSASYDIKATAIGDSVYFGTVGSTTPAFGTSTANVIIYKDGVPDLSNPTNSQYKIAVSYSQPVTGVTVYSNGTTYIVAQDNTAEFLVTYSIALSGSTSTHTYAIQLGGISWLTLGVAGVQTTNFFSAETAWRSAAISLP